MRHLKMTDPQRTIIEIIADCFQMKADEITMDLSAGDIPQWNSVGQINLIATLEDKLKIEFPIDELFELNNVQAIVDSAERLLKD